MRGERDLAEVGCHGLHRVWPQGEGYRLGQVGNPLNGIHDTLRTMYEAIQRGCASSMPSFEHVEEM